MIKYALECDGGHRFDAWFGNMADYDRQELAGDLICPACASRSVTKALMAPAITGGARPQAEGPESAAMPVTFDAQIAAMRAYLAANFTNVGPAFAEEARKIHYGEVAHRQIYGQATPADVERLHDEGVSISPLPPFLVDGVPDNAKLN